MSILWPVLDEPFMNLNEKVKFHLNHKIVKTIADFHKFEIDYLLKSYSITIADVPKGDLYSGLSDEEVFNTSYLDLAYYSYCKCKDLPISLNPTLENLHTKNHHKYMGQTFNPYFIKDDDYYFIYQGNS